jgi:hypothetical protein
VDCSPRASRRSRESGGEELKPLGEVERWTRQSKRTKKRRQSAGAQVDDEDSELELENMESIRVRWGTADSLPEFDRERGEKDRELTGGSLVRSERTKVTTGMKFRR